MATLFLRFVQEYQKVLETISGGDRFGTASGMTRHQNVYTSSRNDDPFVTFLQEYHKI